MFYLFYFHLDKLDIFKVAYNFKAMMEVKKAIQDHEAETYNIPSFLYVALMDIFLTKVCLFKALTLCQCKIFNFFKMLISSDFFSRLWHKQKKIWLHTRSRLQQNNKKETAGGQAKQSTYWQILNFWFLTDLFCKGLSFYRLFCIIRYFAVFRWKLITALLNPDFEPKIQRSWTVQLLSYWETYWFFLEFKLLSEK